MGFHIGRGERETKKKNGETDSLWPFFDRSVWRKMPSNTPNCPPMTVFLSIFSSPKQKSEMKCFCSSLCLSIDFSFLGQIGIPTFRTFSYKHRHKSQNEHFNFIETDVFKRSIFYYWKCNIINMHVNWKWIPQKNHSANNGRQQKLIAQSTHNEEKDKHFFMLEIKNDVKSWAR